MYLNCLSNELRKVEHVIASVRRRLDGLAASQADAMAVDSDGQCVFTSGPVTKRLRTACCTLRDDLKSSLLSLGKAGCRLQDLAALKYDIECDSPVGEIPEAQVLEVTGGKRPREFKTKRSAGNVEFIECPMHYTLANSSAPGRKYVIAMQRRNELAFWNSGAEQWMPYGFLNIFTERITMLYVAFVPAPQFSDILSHAPQQPGTYFIKFGFRNAQRHTDPPHDIVNNYLPKKFPLLNMLWEAGPAPAGLFFFRAPTVLSDRHAEGLLQAMFLNTCLLKTHSINSSGYVPPLGTAQTNVSYEWWYARSSDVPCHCSLQLCEDAAHNSTLCRLVAELRTFSRQPNLLPTRVVKSAGGDKLKAWVGGGDVYFWNT